MTPNEISPITTQRIASQYPQPKPVAKTEQKTVPSPAAKTGKFTESMERINKYAEQAVTSSTPPPETRMAFNVDPNSHEVFIMVQDKATNKVLRTIPAEAIKNLPPCDLFRYSA